MATILGPGGPIILLQTVWGDQFRGGDRPRRDSITFPSTDEGILPSSMHGPTILLVVLHRTLGGEARRSYHQSLRSQDGHSFVRMAPEPN